MEELEQQVLSYVQRNGPVLPIQVSKLIEKDMFLTGAILSELIRRGQIRITAAKVGGSPLYYAPGQDSKLFVLYQHLPLKERQAYDLLKKASLMKDSETEPSIRVAFRNLRDFAVPMELELEGRKEVFWRWHLINTEEANQIFNQKYRKIEIRIPVKPQSAQQIQTQVQEVKPELEIKIEKPKIEKQEKLKPKKTKDVEDVFLNDINSYLRRKNIQIIETNTIKKNKEIEMIVNIPSELGNLTYLLSAKNKTKISDSDLLHAYQKAQEKRLPALLISTGELSKKASKYVEEKLRGLAFRKI